MHTKNPKTLFDLLNRTRSKPRKLAFAQQVQIYQYRCYSCGHTITPAEYNSDFCPWCGLYGTGQSH